MKKYCGNNLFLDDIRNPDYIGLHGLDVVRSSEEAKQYVTTHGCPEFISFDHDLGGMDTAMHFVKWLINKDMDENGAIIPPNFSFFVHSQNPIGKANIESYLNNYLRTKDNNVV